MRQICHQSASDRITHQCEDNRNGLCLQFQGCQARIGPYDEQLGRTRDKLGGANANAVDVLRCEVHVELDVAAFYPAKFTESLFERRPELSRLRIICIVEGQQNPDPPHALGLLRTSSQGPGRGHRSAKQQHEWRRLIAALQVRTGHLNELN